MSTELCMTWCFRTCNEKLWIKPSSTTKPSQMTTRLSISIFWQFFFKYCPQVTNIFQLFKQEKTNLKSAFWLGKNSTNTVRKRHDQRDRNTDEIQYLFGFPGRKTIIINLNSGWHLGHEKSPALLSMTYWLFNDGILISWFIIIPT